MGRLAASYGRRSFASWQGYAMNYFSSEKFSGSTTREERRCRCDAQPKLVFKMMDPRRGLTVRMFECNCGNRTWTEDSE